MNEGNCASLILIRANISRGQVRVSRVAPISPQVQVK